MATVSTRRCGPHLSVTSQNSECNESKKEGKFKVLAGLDLCDPRCRRSRSRNEADTLLRLFAHCHTAVSIVIIITIRRHISSFAVLRQKDRLRGIFYISEVLVCPLEILHRMGCDGKETRKFKTISPNSSGNILLVLKNALYQQRRSSSSHNSLRGICQGCTPRPGPAPGKMAASGSPGAPSCPEAN